MRSNRQAFVAAISLLLAVLIAAWGMLPPALRSPDASGDGVQVARMLADLRDISREPHVTGSIANARVRDLLVSRLQAIGLETSVQRSDGVRQSTRGNRSIAVAPVENIVAVLPGRNRSGPAVAVMAHYDSVPFSHGAGDDGAGVVSVLETARILANGPVPTRDVIFILTDGEELGLIGAQTFFAEHPLARRIGIVVNAEARGARGRATMFQTSTGDAALVALWARNATSPSGNSLAGTIYRLLPNDTDLSVPLAMGIAGINAAFSGGHFDYHSTTDRFGHVDPRSVQHLGDFTLTTARALALAGQLPDRNADAVYFDVLGMMVVRYPPWVGWLLLALAAGGWLMLVRRDHDLAARALWRGAGTALLATIIAGGVTHACGHWLTGSGAIAFRERMAEESELLIPMALLVLGTFLLLKPQRSLVFGTIALLIIGALAAQIWLPGGGFLFIWPALTALMLMARPHRHQWPAQVARIAIVAIVLGTVLQLVATAWVSVGLLSAGVVAAAVPFLIVLIGPLLVTQPWQPGPRERRMARTGSAIAIAAGVAGLVIIATKDGFSVRQPRPGDFFALSDTRNNSHSWASTSGAAMLPSGPTGAFRDDAFPRFRPATTAAAAAHPLAPWRIPVITESTNGEGRHNVTIRTAVPPRVLSIAIRLPDDARDIRVNGRPVATNPEGWTSIIYRAQHPAEITVSSLTSAAQPFAIRTLLATPGLPPGAPRTAGLATNWASFTGTQVTVSEWPAPSAGPVVARSPGDLP